MKIILLKDVPKIGRKHDIVSVSDGYAINFLFPKKLAEPATAKKEAETEKMKKEIQAEKDFQSSEESKNLSKIEGVELILKAKASEGGHLFSGIRKEEIAEKIANDYKVKIPQEFISLEKPIKKTGEYKVEIQGKRSKAQIKLVVESL